MATKSIVGEKVGMTQVWTDDGRVVPVTVVRVEPARVVQVKTPERDGYGALQVTYGNRDPRKVNKPLAGHYARGSVEPGKRLVELRLEDVSDYEVGATIGADTFSPGEKVDVTAVSKGKGFAGAMKRHGFAGNNASHGAKRVHRTPGAIGACATPARVFPGTRLPGRMGGERVTTQNLEVVRADAEAGVLLVKGAVPGPNGGVVIVRNAAKFATKGGK